MFKSPCTSPHAIVPITRLGGQEICWDNHTFNAVAKVPPRGPRFDLSVKLGAWDIAQAAYLNKVDASVCLEGRRKIGSTPTSPTSAIPRPQSFDISRYVVIGSLIGIRLANDRAQSLSWRR